MIRTLSLSLVLAVGLVACAARQHLREGDRLLKAGQYREAISAYEEALRVSPDNATAKKGIREARRQAVRVELDRADQDLSAGRFAGALGYAMRARSLPLDLEDVDLVRRIDDTVTRAARLAEDEVRQLTSQARYVEAVELARQIVEASPGVESRRQWADEVSKEAAGFYANAAQDLEGRGLVGSAAIQLALAKRVGGDVEATRVEALWNKFAEPTCFASPEIQVNDRTSKGGDLVESIRTTARSELDGVRERCGVGTRPLGVTIELTKVDVVDESAKQRAAKPLPGVDIQTEETYYEEVPRTVVEEVTEYETRVEDVEKRDCAPRPGQERGCRSWVEQVETKVPVKRKREVTKIERIQRTRPVKGPLPEDKVLTYEVTTVTRRVVYEGTVQVVGAKEPRKFVVRVESVDSGNAEASKMGLTVRADPLEVKEMDALRREAADQVAAAVRQGVGDAVALWSQEFQKEAGRNFREGNIPQAEEQYLKLLALGGRPDEVMARFFGQRYGASIGAVMDMLAVALGRTPPPRPIGGASDAATEMARFPTRQDDAATPEGEEPSSKVAFEKKDQPQGGDAPAKTDEQARPAMSDEELRALEEASIEEGKPAEQQPSAAEEEPKTGEEPAAESKEAAPGSGEAAPAPSEGAAGSGEG